MNYLNKTTLLCALALAPFSLQAQTEQKKVETGANTITLTPQKIPVRKFYLGNSLDAGIFSTSFVTKEGASRQTTPLRFTMFLHLGYTFNYDFNKYSGVYTGVDLKNIGFIEKEGGYTAKRRVYTVGVPVGLRFGNMKKRNYFYLGAGLDLAVNYKEKVYDKRSDKKKFNEWFSSRTPLLMPYVFAGYSFDHGISVKVQYYPNSFLNQNFTEDVGGISVQPYADYKKVNLLLFSVGFDMHYKMNKYK